MGIVPSAVQKRSPSGSVWTYNRAMSLTLYRRHARDCRVEESGLSSSEKRFFTDCDCPIWITGTTDRERYPRQSLGLRDWKAAEAKLRALVHGSTDEKVHGPTIEHCVNRYLDSRKADLGSKARGHYELLLARLSEFAGSRGVYFIRELTVDLLEDFKTYGLPNIKKSTSRATNIAKLKCFLREAYRREWILTPVVEKLKSHKAEYQQKQPFSDEEIDAVLVTAEQLGGGTHGYAKRGKTFRLLLELMLHTGMRVGDAVRFDPRHCERLDPLWVYTFAPRKQRKTDASRTIDIYISDHLKSAIDTCSWLSKALPFAYRPVAPEDGPDYLAQAVYERMQAIGRRCGVVDCRPHRLRDTFAVRALLKGISIEDVSQLLGHSSIAITQKYYAPWIPARKARLAGLLAEAFMDS